MLALVQEGIDKSSIRLKEIPQPPYGDDEVKIRVIFAGICGTDVHGISSLRPPVVLGHEFSGVVVAVGKKVQKVRVGDFVTSETTVYRCGRCPYCAKGFFNLCPERRGIGSGVDGAFAEYVVVPEFAVHKLPDFLSLEEGALLEPLACAIRGVMEQASLQGSEKVVVFGPGPLGILVSWVAKALGSRVILVGGPGDEERFRVALAGGVDDTLDFTQVDLQRVVQEVLDPYGADVVFECSGSPQAVCSGLSILRKRGVFIQMGILHREVSIDFDRFLFSSEIVLLGSRTQTTSSWHKAFDFLERKRLPLRMLISHILPLAKWQEGFALIREKKAIKVLLKP
ncbi:MAG: alcohol dehydrogenase catalytic domain-containing protein [Candidatus Caldatribacterium sp.]|uniref:zinc-dependent alcohol dehydrogenase n=1 Tax=Candidatus Caldatribacterium sp. TaxID=2282143 RepID=UPI002995ADC4|nr:alcohol dehydrogenase catalytic domain-containing protein [Candidatus Caldatribacterium sp.]MCX7731008.1 alcohol dehydrogenase catalytic domain-containing protein [Candidatus Caldatribacterium sp.]MDW8081818.1 alcohol dehydrogenase catalytic domain-containing protein [Candidatus Calescibacterium sp.]